MHIIHTIEQLTVALKNRAKIAFVPTMGNLHAGHMQLIEVAKQYADFVVVSIFVNPLQFAPTEDLATYPRTLAADCEKLKIAGASVAFVPSVEEMYPDFDGTHLKQTMTITPPPIGSELCGAFRPGHFAGVATVVMKLFNIVRPDVAVFGQKDFQQFFIIKELVRQFNLPVDVIGVDTVREQDGLAMSSRNHYLTASQRACASELNQALQRIVSAVKSGNQHYIALEEEARTALNEQNWQVDYISIRSALTLLPAGNQDAELVVLAAAMLGTTRLIDNIEFLR